ncbi:MAG: threonylcarbamoyl-AMP synthase [Akkermansiaceae bacterium]|nr:threonylcarbamoyl-AMP synthase [Akkermansiaceae bacterium]
MQTRVIEVDPLEDCRKVYKEAAAVLEEGGLVAIPTETVYGLGADALNTEAVADVFSVKERPSFDPLICHFPNGKAIKDYTDVPEELQALVDKLAKEFWPGPMTLVLPRKPIIPDIVTSGLPTVACRVPSHEVMRGVARALGHPIAAPSANRFGHISPTSAGAVLKELGGSIPLVLDAGACSEGLESTILMPCLDEKGKPAVRLLREGPITREKLRGICRVLKPGKGKNAAEEALPNAPGQLKSHYAPCKPLILWNPKEEFTPEEGVNYGLITYEGDSPLAAQDCWVETMPLSPGSGRLAEAAVRLFAVMRAMDENEEVQVIVAEELPEIGLGCAMMDRLRRASSKRGE